MLLGLRARKKKLCIAITIVGRAKTKEREIKERYYAKIEAKKIKSDNFTRSNREKTNIAIANLMEN